VETVVEEVPVLSEHVVYCSAGGQAAQQAVPGRLHHLQTLPFSDLNGLLMGAVIASRYRSVKV
jgi:hypothetical protein